ncbi:MAG: type VI secretion system contractile sheath large subunit [Thermodesulfobacteriota bacterium]|nr:type VI secretion system contractile sheath large subunit [Thermodesulfobacteriota bacterium]
MNIPSRPFKILALAPFRPMEEVAWSEDPIRVHKTDLDGVIRGLGIMIHLPIPGDFCHVEGLDITFNRLKDFHPDGLVRNSPFLNNILDVRCIVEDAAQKGLSPREIINQLQERPDLPSIEIPVEHEKTDMHSRSSVDDILNMVALPEGLPSPPAKIIPLISQIDAILQQILKHIFSYEKFREQEAVWRGLRLLMEQGGMGGDVSIEIVPISLDTLDETLRNLLGGLVQDLPSLIIIDLPFDSSPRSLDLLEKSAEFSEALLVPVVSWINHRFLHLDNWHDLKKRPFLPHYFNGPAFAKWRRLRNDPVSRWLTVTCNRVLVRYPYGENNKPRTVQFQEHHNLWVSPVWAIGALIGQSHVKTGWPTRFTDWRVIRLKNLACNATSGRMRVSTETELSDERIHQFISSGITPLVPFTSEDTAFAPAETTVAGTSLCHQLLLSRLAHFIIWCKDNFKGGLKPAEIEKDLRQAVSLFWERSGHPSPEDLEIRAGHPNNEGRIPLQFLLTPSLQVLPSRERIEMEFYW